MIKKLVIADIDSTLAPPHMPISQATYEAIWRLHEAGISFGIASGRPLDEVARKAKDWKIPEPTILIGMNGSELFNGLSQSQTNFYQLKKEWLKSIIEDMAPFSQEPIIYEDGDLVSTKYTERLDQAAKATYKKLRLEPIEHFWQRDNAKVMFRLTTDTIDDVISQLPDNPHYGHFKTQVDLLEFMDRRINKGYALVKFCQQVGLDLADVIAFGDTDNDNQMLIEAGTGVAMANAAQTTKAIADDVTTYPCEQDGLAHYINTKILKV